MSLALVSLLILVPGTVDLPRCPDPEAAPERILGVYLNLEPGCLHGLDRVDGRDCDRAPPNMARAARGQSRIEISRRAHGAWVQAEQVDERGDACWHSGEAQWAGGVLRFPVGEGCVLGLAFDEWGVTVDAPRGCSASCAGDARWGGLVRRRILPWDDTGVGRRYAPRPPPPPVTPLPPSAVAPGETHMEERVQQAGRWRAIERDYGYWHPRAFFRSERHELYRQGPQDRHPVLLRTDVGVQVPAVLLREDGVLFASGGASESAQLYFAGSVEPLNFDLPAPQDGKAHRFLLDAAWSLGDLVLYDRSDGSDDYRMIGWFRVDAANRRVAGQEVIFEVGGPNAPSVGAVRIVRGTVFRVGEHLLWLNEGYRNDWYPDTVQGPWKARRMRAWSLSARELVDPDLLPIPVLAAAEPTLREAQSSCTADGLRECIRWAGWALERLRWRPGWEARDTRARCERR